MYVFPFVIFQVMQLLQVFSRRLPQDLLNNYKNELTSHIRGPGSGNDLFSLLPIPLSDGAADAMRLMQIVSGYEQLQKAGLLQNALPKMFQTGKGIGTAILNSVFSVSCSKCGDPWLSGEDVQPRIKGPQVISDHFISTCSPLQLDCMVYEMPSSVWIACDSGT
jgi:hypothetical protein